MMITRFRKVKTAWIGYSDERYENYWNWRLAGITSHDTTYKNWNSNDNSAVKDCATINDENGKWKTLQCDQKNKFFCEKGQCNSNQ